MRDLCVRFAAVLSSGERLSRVLGSRWVRDVLTPRRRLAPVSAAELSIADLAPSLDRYTIAALADLHHTPHADLAWLSHAIDTVNATLPDLIVLLGDYGESFRRSRILSQRWYREALDEHDSVLGSATRA